MATEKYLLTIAGSADGMEMESTHVMSSDDAVANATLANGEDLLDAWDTDAKTIWLAFNSNRYSLRYVQARRINPTGSAVARKQYQFVTQLGAIDEAFVGSNIAPAVRLIPSVLGRTAGRVFLPPPPDIYIDANQYDATYVTDVGLYFDALIGGITDGFEWTLNIHHRLANVYSTVAGYNLSPSIGFQGRRRYPIG